MRVAISLQITAAEPNHVASFMKSLADIGFSFLLEVTHSALPECTDEYVLDEFQLVMDWTPCG